MSRLLRWGSRLPAPVRARLRAIPWIDGLRRRLSGRPRLAGPGAGKPRAVVYLPTWATWDTMRQRPQYIVAAFVDHGHPAYFVDPREPRPRTVDGVEIVPGLAHVPRSGVLLYVHFAPLRTLFPLFKDAIVMYDILDDLTIFHADEELLPDDRRVAAHHPDVIARADVVTVSAPALADRHRAERADLILMENGVDPERFRRIRPRPGDVPPADPDHPVAGYHGAISRWFDFDLLSAVAEALPDWRFVLVGPVDDRVSAEAHQLTMLANVSLLGEKSPDDIPAYVQAFDVGTIWFEVSHLTEAVSPLKMYEYLAAAKPCVSTPLPTAENVTGVRTARSAGEFVQSLRSALSDGDDPVFRHRAHDEAEKASWVHRLEPVLSRLEEHDLRRVASPNPGPGNRS